MARGSRLRRRIPGGATAVVVLLAVAACGGGGGTGDVEPADGGDLAGRSFVSTGSSGRELVTGTEVRLVFGRDRVSVHAGCNVLQGAATWDDGALVVEQPVAVTLMACDDALQEQDDWLVGFLAAAPAVRLDGSTLTLGDASESLVLDEQ